MNPESLLDQLRDIHGPEAISWWPPAPGWWLLALLILIVLFYGAQWIYRWRKKTAWRRQALRELPLLKARYIQSPTANNLAELVTLLKRCLASQKNQRTLLSLSGDQWAEHLNQASHFLSQDDIEILTQGHYQSTPPVLDECAFDRVEKWIKRQQ